MKRCFWVLAFSLAGSVAAEKPPVPPTPLFASEQPINITIQGPISTLVANRKSPPLPATLTFDGAAYPITLAPRGITRLTREVCDFPPLTVEFTPPPPAGSLFP